MAHLDRRVSNADNEDVLCNLSLASLADSEDGRLILDQAALVDTLFSGAPLRAKFSGNKLQALELARQMLAARDLYQALHWVLGALETVLEANGTVATNTEHREVIKAAELALALADGDQEMVDVLRKDQP